MIAERLRVAVASRSATGLREFDLGFVLLFGTVFLLVGSLPLVAGYLLAPPDREFMGLVHNVHDYAQYRSWARESMTAVLVENKLTPEHTQPVFFNLYWWIVGRTMRLTGLGFSQVDQAFRLLSGYLLVFSAAWFVGSMLQSQFQRRFALALACLASGFGWVLVVLKQVTGQLREPLLVHNSLSNTFYSTMIVPHHVLAAAMLPVIFLLVMQGYQRVCGRRMLLAGLLTLILGLFHTYDLVLIYAVIGCFSLVMALRAGLQWRRILGLIVFGVASAPAPIFWMWVTLTSQEWRGVLDQFRNLGVFTPNPLGVIILVGPTLVLALCTFRGFVPLNRLRDDDVLLSSWLVVNLLVIYLPLNFQIMMLNGLQVGLAVLATRGLFNHVIPWTQQTLQRVSAGNRGLAAKIEPRLGILIPGLFLALVLPTNLYLFGWRINDLARAPYPIYLYRDDVQALDWLASHATGDDVILASMDIGHYVPGLTGAHAFLAHGAGTLRFYEKVAMVQAFYRADTDDAVRRAMLDTYHVRYVIYGPSERRLGTFSPDQSQALRRVFDRPDTQVYEVVRPVGTLTDSPDRGELR